MTDIELKKAMNFGYFLEHGTWPPYGFWLAEAEHLQKLKERAKIPPKPVFIECSYCLYVGEEYQFLPFPNSARVCPRCNKFKTRKKRWGVGGI